MIPNLTIHDLSTHRNIAVHRVILSQFEFRIISVIEGFSLPIQQPLTRGQRQRVRVNGLEIIGRVLDGIDPVQLALPVVRKDDRHLFFLHKISI
jgi:hypothetical protein